MIDAGRLPCNTQVVSADVHMSARRVHLTPQVAYRGRVRIALDAVSCLRGISARRANSLPTSATPMSA